MSETIVSTQALVDHYRPLYAEYQRLVERFASDDADFTPGSPNWNRCAAALHEAGWSIGDLNAHTIRLAALSMIIAPASQPEWVGPVPEWATEMFCQFRKDSPVLEVEFSRDVHPLSVSVDWVLDLERGTFTHSGVVYAILGERVLRDEIAALPDAVADILGVAVFGEVSRD